MRSGVRIIIQGNEIKFERQIKKGGVEKLSYILKGGVILREEAVAIAAGAVAGTTGTTEVGGEAATGQCGWRNTGLPPGLTIVSPLRTSVAR